MPEEQEQNRIDDEEATGGGYSFPVFTMWIVYGFLLVVIAQVSFPWGRATLHGVYLFTVVLFMLTAFSKKALKKARQVDKTMTSGTWKFNNLLFFVVTPLVVWAGLMSIRGWRF